MSYDTVEETEGGSIGADQPAELNSTEGAGGASSLTEHQADLSAPHTTHSFSRRWRKRLSSEGAGNIYLFTLLALGVSIAFAAVSALSHTHS